jgi:transposase
LLGVQEFPTTPAGNRQLLGWLASLGTVGRVGVEGTGSYGASLARYLGRCGVAVVEVDRPNRQARRRHGKTDTVDAVQAARTALAKDELGAAKTKDGNIEAIRALLVARRSARSMRIATMNQIRHLGFTAPDDIRLALNGVSRVLIARAAAGMRPREGSDPVIFATKTSLRSLGRRALALQAEIDSMDKLLGRLIGEHHEDLLSLYGVGVQSAALLLVAAGDNPQRMKSEAAWARMCGVTPMEASSGKVIRHRLNPGGNRQANSALWHIVLTRMSSDPRTRAYVERRTKEGKSKKEIIRVLKRYVAREMYYYLAPL